jgi:hypothetical protein
LPGPGPYAWPPRAAEGAPGRDLGDVHAKESRQREFIYVTDLPEGWCGVNDADAEAQLRLSWDAELPFLWLFLTYGGWRDCYTAVLEPCTNMPKDLSEAALAGQSAFLEVGGVFETRVAVALTSLDGAEAREQNA